MPRALSNIRMPPLVIDQRRFFKPTHCQVNLFLRKQDRRAQDICLPLVPVLAGFQLSRRIGCLCGISHFAGCLYLFRFQLEENLMGALVGKGKSSLGTEPLHVAGSNEALVQDNLITLQSQCTRNAKLRDLVLGVGIGSDTADASIRRETGE